MATNTSIKEIDFFGLEPRLQLQVKKASRAIDDGHPWYAVDICRYVIRRQPGCLAVRKILRKAQKKNYPSGSHKFAAIINSVFSWGDILWGKYILSKYPYSALNMAEKILSRQPIAGLYRAVPGFCANGAIRPARNSPETTSQCGQPACYGQCLSRLGPFIRSRKNGRQDSGDRTHERSRAQID